jgi:hypothetical protein
MKIKSTDGMGWIASFGILLLFTCATISLGWGFSHNLAFQLLFGLLGGVIFEAGHYWAWIKTKTLWNVKDTITSVKRDFRGKEITKTKILWKRTPYLILAIICATYTIVAAISLSGRIIQEMTAEAVEVRKPVANISEMITYNKKLIGQKEFFQNMYAGDSNRIESFNKVTKEIDTLQKTNQILEAKYNAINTNTLIIVKSSTGSSDSFSFYADLFKIAKSAVIIILLLFFFLGIEGLYVLTIPEEEIKETQIMRYRDNLLKYVDALMDIEANKTRLNNNAYISEKIGISLPECKSFEDMLSGRHPEIQIYWRDTKGKKIPLVDISQGKRQSNGFSVAQMKSIIHSKANLS